MQEKADEQEQDTEPVALEVEGIHRVTSRQTT